MFALKVMLCDLCILLLGLTTTFAEERGSTTIAAVDEGPRGNCSCGGFPTASPDAGSAPLLAQTPGLVVKCDEEGANTCKSLCTALATATKAKGPEILCKKLKHADELKLSAFYRVCDKPWSYADMTADEVLCCQDGKARACASTDTAAANTTAPLDARTPM